jgi:hypothetical protein
MRYDDVSTYRRFVFTLASVCGAGDFALRHISARAS